MIMDDSIWFIRPNLTLTMIPTRQAIVTIQKFDNNKNRLFGTLEFVLQSVGSM